MDLDGIKPMATDNSGVISLSSSPQLASPHTFSEGITTVIYKAEDPTGNKAYCHFKVSVQGKIIIIIMMMMIIMIVIIVTTIAKNST